LTEHLRKFLEFRVGMGVIDNLVAKCEWFYCFLGQFLNWFCLNFLDIATVIGFYAVSLPFFDKNHKLLVNCDDGERLRVST
jgi:ATP-binding cassette subfamily D (ALD) protein 3